MVKTQASAGAEAALERKRRQTVLQEAFRASRYSPARQELKAAQREANMAELEKRLADAKAHLHDRKLIKELALELAETTKNVTSSKHDRS